MIAPRPWRALARDTRAVAAVEMAIVSTFVLVPLLGGYVGISQAIELQARLDRGVHAALIDAWGQPALTGTSLSTEMTSAVQQGYGTGGGTPSVTAAAAYYCIAPTGTRSGKTAVAQGTTCTAPAVLGKWITVTATVTFTPIVSTVTGWNKSGGIVTLTSTATTRVPCGSSSC